MRQPVCLCLLSLTLLLLAPAAPAAAQSVPAGPAYFPPLTGTEWATVAPASLGWCPDRLAALLDYAGSRRTDALLIVHDGRLVVEKYYGTYTAESTHYWASAGKSLVATLVGLAQQDKMLSLDEPTARLLGAGWTTAPPAKEALITIRHQLSMTTGLDDNLPATPQVPDPDNCLAPPCLAYRADAGTRWAYHNAPYRLLQNVVAQASGLTFNQYTRQRLTTSLGMSGVWLDYTYYSRARDMARFGLFIAARGSWAGTPILTDAAYFRAMTTPSQTLNPSYGYLWWLNGQPNYRLPGPQQVTFPGPLIPAAPADLLAALGRDDQKIYVVPSLRLVVVRQGASAGASISQAASSFDNELWTRIMALYCSATATARPGAVDARYAAFPNPVAAGALLTLRQPAGAATKLRLLDAQGRAVRQQAVSGAESHLGTAGLAAGLYAAQWLDAAGRVLATRRVVRE